VIRDTVWRVRDVKGTWRLKATRYTHCLYHFRVREVIRDTNCIALWLYLSWLHASIQCLCLIFWHVSVKHCEIVSLMRYYLLCVSHDFTRPYRASLVSLHSAHHFPSHITSRITSYLLCISHHFTRPYSAFLVCVSQHLTVLITSHCLCLAFTSLSFSWWEIQPL